MLQPLSTSRPTTGHSKRRWNVPPQRWIEGRLQKCSRDCEKPLPVGRLLSELVLADDSDDHALNQHVSFLEAHRLHGGVGRLKTDPSASLTVKLLDSSLAAVDESDYHLAILGGLLSMDDDDVSIRDVLVDHGCALYPESVIRTAPG